MTGRVPDAAGWWWRCPPGKGNEPEPVNVWRNPNDGRLYCNSRHMRRVQPVADSVDWLGPVAPPCPEGRVRVEMSRDVAAWWCDRLPVAMSYQGDVVTFLREIREALRTALAKGEQ